MACVTAGSQQQFVERVAITSIVRGGFCVEVEGADRATQSQLGVLTLSIDPDPFEGFALPQRFGQWRSLVWWVRFIANQGDLPLRVDVADPLHGGSGGHAAPDDQVCGVF